MSAEFNRYREEEKELNEVNEDATENVETNPEADDHHEQNEQEVKEMPNNKKNKKCKKVEDFEEYQKLLAEVEKLNDDLLRNRAELENFKRRTNEERIKERKYALQSFLTDLIGIIDIYDKAVNIQTEDEKLKKFLSGFVMINKNLKQVLERYEVKAIDALNKPFDPAYHNAMETVKIEGVEPNIVVEVVITGYMYKDRVLRPSMVKVSE